MDLSLSTAHEITLTGNITFNTPTNPVLGGTYYVIISQDGVGSRTATFPPEFNFGIEASSLTSTASAVDLLTMLYVDTGVYLCTLSNDFK